MSVPREILKWLLSLDLSYTVKYPRRDFANGFLFAEILSRYYPVDIQMHSFENVASLERKRQNWTVLEKFFRRKGINIDRPQVNAVIAAEGDVCIEVLQTIYNFIQSPSYEQTKLPEARICPDRLHYLSQPRDRGKEASTTGNEEEEEEEQEELYDAADPYQQQYMVQYMTNQGYPNGHNMAPSGSGHSMSSVLPPRQQGGGQGQGPMYIPNPSHGTHPTYTSDNAPYSSLQQQQQQLQLQQYYATLAAQQQQQQYMQQQAVMQDMMPGVHGGYAMPPPVLYGSNAPHTSQAVAASIPPGAGQRYISPSLPRYVSPLLVPTAAQYISAPGSSVLTQPMAGNARFKSPGRPSRPSLQAPAARAQGTSTSASLVSKSAAAPSSLLGAGGMGKSPVMSSYAQQALQAQQQAALAQQMQQQLQHEVSQVLVSSSPKAVEERDGLPYSRKPRHVDYQPYDLKDFEDKEYNIKKEGKGYWQLGRLGPDLETEELQAKREKAERVKQLAAQVREDNMKKAAAAPKPQPRVIKEPTARDRAIEFAKNVPKPEVMIPPPKPEVVKKKPPAAGSAAAARVAAAMGVGPRGAAEATGLEALEAQHKEDQQRVDRIRAELARMM
ncbi:hypothetical protein CEUSTIGMA_g7760.t1 [Chlamydomonas eustigma]|uniref:Calponin-homology (CH) domain-containing protein n=1 Tax=Chlamydomonas eustigma TaxID=1157962 RepID=A0A250XBS2_9CHLO|nr:hypothetical protein CEUSTIGMA_g7760.t1 [Chlamydomonas eustigma]|eukprot:GAX80322.1 hypothetical protein CEUSTIGMA_g7760.t1 [Chlamydomonas eustigma]